MSDFLNKSQRKELLSELRLERNRRFAECIKVILLLDDGERVVDIARFFFLDEGSVRNYKKRFEEGGLEKPVNDHYIGRTSFLNELQKKQLEKGLESQVYPTTQSVIDFVKKEFGVTYKLGGMTSLLHDLGFSYKKPKGVPGKVDVKEQREFINQYNALKGRGPVYFGDSTSYA